MPSFGPAAARARVAIVAMLLALLAGCGDARPRLYPVSGEIFVQGKPAECALLIFRPENADPLQWSGGYPRAIAGSDGTFQVSTFDEGDGAPAGNYTVLVQWPKRSPAADGESLDPEAESTDALGGRYMNPVTSPLKATVREEPTALPRFDLN